MNGEQMVEAILSGTFSEATLAGAVSYHATKGKAFLRIMDKNDSPHREMTEKLNDGSERKTQVASSAAGLKSMGKVNVPPNLPELIAGGFDPLSGLSLEKESVS